MAVKVFSNFYFFVNLIVTFFLVYEELHDRVGFVSKVPWVFILFFFAIGILWNAMGAVVALLNTVARETDTVAGPKGIYLWSVLAGISEILMLHLGNFEFQIMGI